MVTEIDANYELDVLIRELPGLVARSETDPVVGMASVLLWAGFYQRLGDHVVHVARRIRWLATGTDSGRAGPTGTGRQGEFPAANSVSRMAPGPGASGAAHRHVGHSRG